MNDASSSAAAGDGPWARGRERTSAAIEERAERIAHAVNDGPAVLRRTKNRVLHGGHRLLAPAVDIVHEPLGPLDLRGRDGRGACRVVGDPLDVGDDRPKRLLEPPHPLADMTQGTCRDDHGATWPMAMASTETAMTPRKTSITRRIRSHASPPGTDRARDRRRWSTSRGCD